MEVLTKLPVTLDERTEFNEIMRVPATFDEFLDLLEVSEYRVEYDNGEIISYLNHATAAHEEIIPKVARQFFNVLGEDEFSIFGSQLPLSLPVGVRNFNADVTVTKGEGEEATLRGCMKATVNPVLLVEVVSDATRGYDFVQKLRCYTKCPSVQQILFVESVEMLVLSYIRHGEGWLCRLFDLPEDRVPVLDKGHFSLKDIYKKVKLPG